MSTVSDPLAAGKRRSGADAFPRTKAHDAPALALAMQLFAERYPPARVLRRGLMAIDHRLHPIELMGDLSVRVLTPDGTFIVHWSEPGAFAAEALAPRRKKAR